MIGKRCECVVIPFPFVSLVFVWEINCLRVEEGKSETLRFSIVFGLLMFL